MTNKTDDAKHAKPEPEVPVIMLKGYQPLAPGAEKLQKGQGALLPLSEAKTVLAAKIAERNDPLPGEDE